MKKYLILFLIGSLMIGNIEIVYGQSFNMNSPGMEIFERFNKFQMTKYDVEKMLGKTNESEKMFHSVYNYSINNAKGKLKVRYQDTKDDICSEEITKEIDEDTSVGRILWKESNSSQKMKYSYQIQHLGELAYGTTLEDTLNLFRNTPCYIDVMPSYTIIKYRDYPLYDEKGTLMLTFVDGKMDQDYSSWTFFMSQKERFSDYSELICKMWLTSIEELLDSSKDSDDPEMVISMAGLKKVCDYYQEIFKKKNRQEMKTLDSLLRDLYDENHKCEIMDSIEEWSDYNIENIESIDMNVAAEEFLNIWKTPSEDARTWDEIVKENLNGHYMKVGTVVNLWEDTYDENWNKFKSKHITIAYEDTDE